jgi:predicted DNA-binding transcriptional regulator AlpA
MPEFTTIPESTVRVSVSKVAARYSVSTRTVSRWQNSKTLNFPQPIKINEYRYWLVTDLERWERERAAASIAA